MASNYTANYGLSQWAAGDKVLRTEFNENNAKIDAAIKSVDNRLTSVAAGKVSTSELSALQSTVTAQGTALSLRNCRFVTGSYTGTGKYGASNPNTLSFSYKPVFLCVVSNDTGMVMNLVAGQSSTFISEGGLSTLKVSWGSRSVSWHVENPSAASAAPAHQMNAQGTYCYLAILEIA